MCVSVPCSPAAAELTRQPRPPAGPSDRLARCPAPCAPCLYTEGTAASVALADGDSFQLFLPSVFHIIFFTPFIFSFLYFPFSVLDPFFRLLLHCLFSWRFWCRRQVPTDGRGGTVPGAAQRGIPAADGKGASRCMAAEGCALAERVPAEGRARERRLDGPERDRRHH